DLHIPLLEEIGDWHQQREPRSADTGLHTSETKDDASIELLDDPNGCAQPEHTKAEPCGQCVKDDHDVLHFRLGKTCRYFSASAGDLQPMKRRHPSSMGRSLETCSDPRSGPRLCPGCARGHRHDALGA